MSNLVKYSLLVAIFISVMFLLAVWVATSKFHWDIAVLLAIYIFLVEYFYNFRNL